MQLLLTRHCLESVQGAPLFPVLFRIHNPRLPRSRKTVGSITVGYRRFAWGTNVLSKSLPLHAHRLIHHPQPTLLQPVRTITIRQLNAKWKSIHKQFSAVLLYPLCAAQICWRVGDNSWYFMRACEKLQKATLNFNVWYSVHFRIWL